MPLPRQHDVVEMTPRESLLWLAGVLEGEGCFSIEKDSRRPWVTVPVVVMESTDESVMAHISYMLGLLYQRKAARRDVCKPSYRLRVGGRKAKSLMAAVYPFMSPRRQGRIDEIWEKTPHVSELDEFELVVGPRYTPWAGIFGES